MESSITHIRPRFKLTVPQPRETVRKRVSALIEKNKGKIKARIIDDHVILDIIGEDVHYWSPQLNFRVEEDEDFPEHTSVAGLIGPRPKVWTMFVFIYFSLGIIGFFISSHGVSKYMLDEYSHTIWAFPIAVLLMLTAYQAGKYGESLGKDQIEHLKQFVREVVSPEENL